MKIDFFIIFDFILLIGLNVDCLHFNNPASTMIYNDI